MRWLVLVVVSGCAAVGGRPVALTQNRELEGFSAVAALPDSEDAVVLVAMQQFLVANRAGEGLAWARAQRAAWPDRALFLSVEGVFEARLADEVPLLQRIAWVRGAMAKLDAGAKGSPLVGRYLRGLVFSELPPRFEAAKTAIEDLQASLARRQAFPFDPERGAYLGLARAHRTLGDEAAAVAWLQKAGGEAQAFSSNVSVGPLAGFRFSEPRLVEEAPGVYVAEGFDMSNLAFLVNEAGVLAIDAGSTIEGAKAALAALRRVTQAKVTTVVLTHAHWDHVGGLPALLGDRPEVIASADFPHELERVRSVRQAYRWFFGEAPRDLQVAPTRLVREKTTLRHGAVELELLPGPSGETDDALYVRLPAQGLLFVGDVLMPYVGSPFVGEGSAQGYLDALAFIRGLQPKRLVHGHPPLTRYFTIEALPGLEAALRELSVRVDQGVLEAKPLSQLLHDGFVPTSLAGAPAAAQPYLVVRDHFIAKAHQQRAGRWAKGEAVDRFTRAEWAAVLDVAVGESAARLQSLVARLLASGDGPMALEVAELGLERHPGNEGLLAARAKAVTAVRQRFELVNPFRFIVASEGGAQPLPPVEGSAEVQRPAGVP